MTSSFSSRIDILDDFVDDTELLAVLDRLETRNVNSNPQAGMPGPVVSASNTIAALSNIPDSDLAEGASAKITAATGIIPDQGLSDSNTIAAATDTATYDFIQGTRASPTAVPVSNPYDALDNSCFKRIPPEAHVMIVKLALQGNGVSIHDDRAPGILLSCKYFKELCKEFRDKNDHFVMDVNRGLTVSQLRRFSNRHRDVAKHVRIARIPKRDDYLYRIITKGIRFCPALESLTFSVHSSILVAFARSLVRNATQAGFKAPIFRLTSTSKLFHADEVAILEDDKSNKDPKALKQLWTVFDQPQQQIAQNNQQQQGIVLPQRDGVCQWRCFEQLKWLHVGRDNLRIRVETHLDRPVLEALGAFQCVAVMHSIRTPAAEKQTSVEKTAVEVMIFETFPNNPPWK